MAKPLIKKFGLFGPLSLLSYSAAVIFSPLAYPGYDWMSQAVSDLSAINAPSLTLWNQLSSIYNVSGLVCLMMVCVFIQGKLNKNIRLGIYFHTVVSWISAIGYGMFPLSDSGYVGTIQDFVHVFVITPVVIILSIVSLAFIIIGGLRDIRHRDLSLWALASLALMFSGAFGSILAPAKYFGIFERFSVFSATGFTAVLGFYLYTGFKPLTIAKADTTAKSKMG